MATSGTASAQTSGAVSWTDANFSGYASGTELHTGVLPNSATPVANVDQAFSAATVNSKGLGGQQTNSLGSIVQPTLTGQSAYSYGTGTGLAIGLGQTSPQIQLAGQASQKALPNGSPQTQSIGLPSQIPSAVATASLLTGQGAAVWGQCVIGQDMSYGLGNAAAVGLLDPGTGPTLTTAGTGTSVAQTTSSTFISKNPDGTFGLSTRAADIIAPITANIGGQVQLKVAVQSAGGVDDPVSLTATTPGEGTGSVTMSSDDILKVDLIAGGTTTPVITIPLSAVGPNGLHIPLGTSDLAGLLTTLTGAVASVTSSVATQVPGVGPTVGGAVNQVLTNPQVTSLLQQVGTSVNSVLNQVATVDLGYIDVDVRPHAIGGSQTSAPLTTDTKAAGALDLLHIHLGVSATAGGQALPVPAQLADIADVNVGHLEAAANLAAPISGCLPVTKTANPTSVQAGQQFTYNISVPDPNQANFVNCDLTNMTVTDVISDYQGTPSFNVTSALDPTGKSGTVNQTDAHHATVTWTNETWKHGAPALAFTIGVSVPGTSTSGIIQDTVTATGTTANCQGGADAAAADGATLSGSYNLQQPSVSTPLSPGSAPKLPTKLPFTGATGGLWQPMAGLGLLGLGGGSLALVRRARRR